MEKPDFVLKLPPEIAAELLHDLDEVGGVEAFMQSPELMKKWGLRDLMGTS